MSLADTTGHDVGPILQATSDHYGVPLIVLLTCAKAESGLDPGAFRDDGPADTSVGPFQQVVLWAKGYGVGDGTYSATNVFHCRQAFSDWTLASDVAARHLQGDMASVPQDQTADEDTYVLGIMSVYNAGHYCPPGDPWWTSEQHAGYSEALTWAKGVLNGAGA